jgi:hypothetical protein
MLFLWHVSALQLACVPAVLYYATICNIVQLTAKENRNLGFTNSLTYRNKTRIKLFLTKCLQMEMTSSMSLRYDQRKSIPRNKVAKNYRS